ncbi:MAG: phytanoyl-CoA dioxygenase family protein [Parvibaculaceae bacterium]
MAMQQDPLSDDLRAAFAREGYLEPIPVFSGPEIAALRERMESFERRRPADAAWAFDVKCNLLFDWVVEAARHPRLLALVEALIGPDILLTNGVFRNKRPGSGLTYGWHQDMARVQVEPAVAIAFIAITESTPENGGVSVIPRTHRSIAPFSVTTTSEGQRRRTVARVIDPPLERVRDLHAAPGDVVFFNANTIHGSGPNRSGRLRSALLFDYTPARARQSVGTGSGQLLKGRDLGNFGLEPFPGGDCRPEDAAARRAVFRRYPDNPLLGPHGPGEPVYFPDAPEFEALQG